MQFDGLERIIQTNVTDLAGAPLTLNALTTTMRNIVTVGGKPQAGLFSYRDLQLISNEVMTTWYRLTQAGAGSLADIPAGVAVNILLAAIKDDYMLETLCILYPHSGKDIEVQTISRKGAKMIELNLDSAYLLGVYYSDGCIQNQRNGKPQRFVVKVIDIEFAEKVKQCAERLLGRKFNIQKYPARGFGKHPFYHVGIGSRELADWIVNASGGKERTIIPPEIASSKELAMSFLQGYMDGDGYSTMRIAFQAGFAGVHENVIDFIAKLFRQYGIELGKKSIEHPRGQTKDGSPKKIMYRYHINAESLAKSGFEFSMPRKQDRLTLCKMLGSSSTTLRRPFIRRMIKSGLMGDHESVAEMTTLPEKE